MSNPILERELVGAPGLADWLARLRPGDLQQSPAMCVVPLVRQGRHGCPPLLMHQALASGALEIREAGAGRVRQVIGSNRGPRPVLVLEGETLLGCKQNRVVARSSIIPARSVRPIEVRCIERERWHGSSETFSSGSMRATPLLRRGRTHRDQRQVWNEIGHTLTSHGVQSATSDYHALLERRGDDLRRLARRFRTVDDQVGVIAIHAGAVIAVELTGHPETWKHVSERSLPAYLLAVENDGTRVPGGPFDPVALARSRLRALRGARVRTSDAGGTGLHLQIDADGLHGSALWCGDAVIHLSVSAEPAGGRGGRPAV